jgi:hypothetical protein
VAATFPANVEMARSSFFLLKAGCVGKGEIQGDAPGNFESTSRVVKTVPSKVLIELQKLPE